LLSICISALHYALFSIPALSKKRINQLRLSIVQTGTDILFLEGGTSLTIAESLKTWKSMGHKIISVQISIDLITGLPANGQFLAGCSRGARHEKIHKKRIIATEDR
jgi:hypothetical protein